MNKSLKVVLSDEAKAQLKKSLASASISGIAQVVRSHWSPSVPARPYLDAMASLDSINDNYGADSGRMIVAYFLCNASQFKGDVAKAVKFELNKRLK